MTKNMPFLTLFSIVVLTIIFLSYSKYLVKTDLDVRILNQTSSCYSGQEPASLAAWTDGNIFIITSFETPDPCYVLKSIKAVRQGDRIEIFMETASGGICVQCFGYKRVEYEIQVQRIEGAMDVYVDIDRTSRQYVRLLPAG